MLGKNTGGFPNRRPPVVLNSPFASPNQNTLRCRRLAHRRHGQRKDRTSIKSTLRQIQALYVPLSLLFNAQHRIQFVRALKNDRRWRLIWEIIFFHFRTITVNRTLVAEINSIALTTRLSWTQIKKKMSSMTSKGTDCWGKLQETFINGRASISTFYSLAQSVLIYGCKFKQLLFFSVSEETISSSFNIKHDFFPSLNL